MMMGGTASRDGNLAQLSKVSKEKTPKKETSPGPETNVCAKAFLCPTVNELYLRTCSLYISGS